MRNKEKYIGVFDSGVGGLTLVKALKEKYPNENIVYLADNKHMPYGDKTDKQIIEYVKNDVAFLNTFELKAVIIACNTADSIASKTIKEIYEMPIFGVIDATAKVASHLTNNNHIGIIATSGTINTNEYEKQILKYNPFAKVHSQACPFLAPLIEEGKFDIGNIEMRYILEDYLSNLINNDIDTLILGCTHYDLLAPIIKDMYPNLNIVSSSRCVIEDIQKHIELNDNKNSEQLYFVTSDKNKFNNVANMIIDNIQAKEI